MFAYVILGLVPPPAPLQVQKWTKPLPSTQRAERPKKGNACVFLMEGEWREGGGTYFND
jgi:hypothetical protein